MTWPLVVILTVPLLYVVWIFNRLVSLRNRARNAWSDIDVQLKRRWDLVPALVSADRIEALDENAVPFGDALPLPRILEVAQIGDLGAKIGLRARHAVEFGTVLHVEWIS